MMVNRTGGHVRGAGVGFEQGYNEVEQEPQI